MTTEEASRKVWSKTVWEFKKTCMGIVNPATRTKALRYPDDLLREPMTWLERVSKLEAATLNYKDQIARSAGIFDPNRTDL